MEEPIDRSSRPTPPGRESDGPGSGDRPGRWDEPRIDALPARLINVFISPGRVMNQIAERPDWMGVLALTTLISAISAAFIPVDLIVETMRQRMIEQGVSVGDFGEAQRNVLRYGRIPGTIVGTLLLQFGIAALYSVIFIFVLGDEGRYKQYLAAVSHGWFIPVLIGVLLLPLVIQTENLELRLTVDVFIVGFFEPGFVRNVAKLLDLTVIWSILVIAQGAHAIDRRRSFSSAAAIMLTIFFMYAIGVGLLQTW